MTKILLIAFVAVLVSWAPPPGLAQDEVREETVRFASGKSGTTVNGSITGYEMVDYRLRAAAGQTMTVTMKTDNLSSYFNVLPPESSDVAVFTGSASGNEYSDTLSATGEYTLRVYMMRNAARRGETANYTLDISILSTGSGAAESVDDAQVSGTPYNATGQVPCARSAGQPMAQCEFGVTRDGGGSGTVTITWPDGGNRVIVFEGGMPVRFDPSEADGGAEMTVGKDADLFKIQIGEQRFEIPEAVISGG